MSAMLWPQCICFSSIEFDHWVIWTLVSYIKPIYSENVLILLDLNKFMHILTFIFLKVSVSALK